MKEVLVIDGQGGNLGREIATQLLKYPNEFSVTIIGTNSMATSNMIKSGAQRAATGAHSAAVCARDSDIIVGPVGIVIADSLLGEVTPEMAFAIAKSKARRILIPINKCNNMIAGVTCSTSELIESAIKIARDYIVD